jgi:hypothetical protein
MNATSVIAKLHVLHCCLARGEWAIFTGLEKGNEGFGWRAKTSSKTGLPWYNGTLCPFFKEIS